MISVRLYCYWHTLTTIGKYTLFNSNTGTSLLLLAPAHYYLNIEIVNGTSTSTNDIKLLGPILHWIYVSPFSFSSCRPCRSFPDSPFQTCRHQYFPPCCPPSPPGGQTQTFKSMYWVKLILKFSGEEFSKWTKRTWPFYEIYSVAQIYGRIFCPF